MLIVITCSPVDVWATVVMMETATTAVMEATVASRGVVVAGSYLVT